MRREYVNWKISVARSYPISSAGQKQKPPLVKHNYSVLEPETEPAPRETMHTSSQGSTTCLTTAAPAGQKIPLYDVAHSRAGDKGNDLNFSMIPHYPPDINRLKTVVTAEWVKEALSTLLNPTSFPSPVNTQRRDDWIDEHVKVEIYEARGIHSLNVVVRNILDGGVNCSRRIDRHGKTISDVILCQQVVLPP